MLPLITAFSSTFIICTDCELPSELISMTRLLLQSDVEWHKTQQKSKLPKPLVDADVLTVVIEVLQNRLAEYPTTTEVSQCVIKNVADLT